MRTALLALSLLFAPAGPPEAGTVSGQVTLATRDSSRADASNAVVWLEGVHRSGAGARTTAGEMKSDQKRFRPRVVAIPINGSVDFPNADAIYHNVFSVSGGNRFDLGLYRSGASKAKQFETPGLVRVYCNIHPQMVGFVMVVDSDFLAVTGPDGKFRFEGVPPGTHTLKAWHEEAAEAATDVTVRAHGDTEASIRLDVSRYKSEPHKNKYGKEYPPQPPSDDERY